MSALDIEKADRDLCDWLREHSSGNYRKSSEAADRIEALKAELAAAKRAAQPAVAGGDGLSLAEAQFLDLVRQRPATKLVSEAWHNNQPLWGKLEAHGIIKSVGSYKWVIVEPASLDAAIHGTIAAHVSGQGGNAEAWNDALEHAAYYVADHCVDGDDHAAALRSMKRKAVSGQGGEDEFLSQMKAALELGAAMYPNGGTARAQIDAAIAAIAAKESSSGSG